MGEAMRTIWRPDQINWQNYYFPVGIEHRIDEEAKNGLTVRSDWRSVKINRNPVSVVTNHFSVDASRLVEYIFHYHVNIFRMDKEGNVKRSDDQSIIGEYSENREVIVNLVSRHPEWASIGWTYDNRSTMFTSAPLGLTPETSRPPSLEECVTTTSLRSEHRYVVRLTEVSVIRTSDREQVCITALDSIAVSFARSGQFKEQPTWFVVGSNIYRSSCADERSVGNPYYVKLGYSLSLRSCLAGLVLVSDLAATCFLIGGPAVNVFAAIEGYDSQEWIRRVSRDPLSDRSLKKIERALTGVKIMVTHLKTKHKVKKIGPPANHPEPFQTEKFGLVTVEQYFECMAQESPLYRDALRGGKLRYPWLPTINIGSKTRPAYVPLELIDVIPGQNLRLSAYTADLQRETIEKAAARPSNRFHHITSDGNRGEESAVSLLRQDECATKFGLNQISPSCMVVPAQLLPPPSCDTRTT